MELDQTGEMRLGLAMGPSENQGRLAYADGEVGVEGDGRRGRGRFEEEVQER